MYQDVFPVIKYILRFGIRFVSLALRLEVKHVYVILVQVNLKLGNEIQGIIREGGKVQDKEMMTTKQ